MRQEMPPDAENQGVILFENVWKEYRSDFLRKRKPALRGVSFAVGRGEVFGYLGPNGAGKTTSMKLLLGLTRPTSGRVLVRGLPASSHKARERIGFLPEQPYFYGHLTGRELLLLFGRMNGLSGRALARDVDRVLEQVGFNGADGELVRKYSKGMVQRVGIAQALLGDPDLLILDEPMSGLDPIGRREVRDLILLLREQGKTVFFSSHILQDAEALCDRVAILVAGELRRVGPVDETPGRQEARLELAASGFDPHILEKLPTVHCVRREGRRFLVEVERDEYVETVIRAIRQAGGTLESLVRRRETLEDRFLREVGSEGSR
jgi:ABC-2 type transport system ATP-binding protein